MKRTVRKVFVDMTLIDGRTRMSGIPRVALAYLEAGYGLARELGIEVIPVHVREGELIDIRPLLLASNLSRFRSQKDLASGFQVLRAALYIALHGARLLAVTVVTPLMVVLEALTSYAFFDFWRHKLRSAFQSAYFAAKHGLNRVLCPRQTFAPGDVLFMPAYWHDTPPGYYAQFRRRGLRVCPLVHDILPITHFEYYESPWREQFKPWVFETLTQSDHVYYISGFTRRSVEAVNELEQLSQLPPGTVCHHGADFAGACTVDEAKLPDALNDGIPFCLMVGSIEPKKNHLRVLAEFESLWRRKKQVRLVIAGSGGWKHEEIKLALGTSPYLHNLLFWLQGPSDKQLHALYRDAAAVIQASEVEGFGLPIIEALSLGTPVLANDIPVFREIGRDHVTYFDVHEPGGLAMAIELLLEGVVARVTGFQWPTWRERALQLYTHLLAAPTQPAQLPRSEPATPPAADKAA